MRIALRNATRRVGVVALCLALGSVAFAACGNNATAKPGAATNTTSCRSANKVKITAAALCKGLSFYNGKTVVFIAPTKAGSAYDVESRAFAKKMGQYLGATVEVTDLGSGETIPGQNEIARATPNGLTIGFYNTASDIYDIVAKVPGVNFNLHKAVLLGGLPNTIPVLATQSNTPYTSFAVLKRDAASSGAPPKLLLTSGASAVQAFLLMREFGINVDYVQGYENSSALMEGFIRGDGPLVGTGIAELQSYIEAGTARALALETPSANIPQGISDHQQLIKVPTVGQLLKQFPPRTNSETTAAQYANAMQAAPNFVLGAPDATPSTRVAALRAAVKFAANSELVRTQVTGVGNLAGYTSPNADRNALITGLQLAPKIANFSGSL